MDWTRVIETGFAVFGGGVLTLFTALYLYSVKDTRDRHHRIAAQYADLLASYTAMQIAFEPFLSQYLDNGRKSALKNSEQYIAARSAWRSCITATDTIRLVDPNENRLVMLSEFSMRLHDVGYCLWEITHEQGLDAQDGESEISNTAIDMDNILNKLSASVRESCVTTTIADIISKS